MGANRAKGKVMNDLKRGDAAALIAAEMTCYRAARQAGDQPWRALERAHIVAQPFFGFHLSSHRDMLDFAISLGDWREAAGQIFRLALARPGSLTGSLPEGNTGRARISAFRLMPVPSDLAGPISPHDKPASR